MAKKKSMGQKLLIVGGVIVAGVVVYKVLLQPRTTTPLPGSTTYVPPAPAAGTGGVLSSLPGILASISQLFKGSGSSTTPTTSGGGSSNPNPADYGMNFLAGRKRTPLL